MANCWVLWSTRGHYMHWWPRVCCRCLNGSPRWGLAVGFGFGSPMSSWCPVQVNSALQELLSCSAVNLPQARDTWALCKGRGATHQAPNTCTALRQDRGLCLTHLSLGQMSIENITAVTDGWTISTQNSFIFTVLEEQQLAGKERGCCCLPGALPFLTS